jgi:bacterioferritin (cytochrome b1)
MKADPKVVASLQQACGVMAHLVAQYRVDIRQLTAMDLDWLACRFKKWFSHSEDHLEIFIDNLLYFGENPSFDGGAVSGTDEGVTAILKRNQKLLTDAMDQFCTARKQAWDILADDITDIFEHAIQEVKKQLVKIERELAIIAEINENNYVAARLEDGKH